VITENPMTALEKRTVGSLALLYSFRMLGLFMVLPLLVLYADDMAGATPALVGLALGIYGLSQALLQIPFGWLSDWLGRKPVIVVGLLVFAAGSLMAALSDNIYALVAGRCLQGAGAIASTLMALAADLTRPEQRTKAMAMIGMSIGLSFALALVLGPLVASFGGLAAVFYVTAALALVGIVIVLLLVPKPPQISVRHTDVGTRLQLIPQSLASATLMRLDVGVFVLHFVLMASFLLVPGFLEGDIGLARERHWLVYLPALLLSFAGMVPMMIVAERGGKPHRMFLTGILLLVIAIMALGLAPGAAVFYAGLWLFFVGFNYMEATLPSLVSKAVFAGGKGTALGVFSTSQFLGAFAGGAVGGWVLQQYAPPVLIGLCVVLLLGWFVLVFPAARFPVVGIAEAEQP
jgi:MFS family permease